MAMVSSLYRMAPSTAWVSPEEAARRLRARIRYLVVAYGQHETERRVRAWRARNDDEAAILTRFLLEIGAVRSGHAAGTV